MDVSVIMPVYNAGSGLSRTLGALRNQTIASVEFICVNDGSTDDSGDVLDLAAARDSRFKIMHSRNQGTFRAREQGIVAASGDYIAFCDAGDEPYPHAYERLFETALSAQADMAICAYERILPPNDRPLVEMIGFGNTVKEVSSESGWLASVNTSVWNKIIRRDIACKYTPLARPPRIMEDAMYLMSIYPYAKRIAFLAESLYRYNVEEGSAMSSLSTDEIDALISDWRLIRASLPNSSGFCEIVDLAVFAHLGVSAHLLLNDRVSKKKIKHALDFNFPYHRQSHFLSPSYAKDNPSMRTLALASLCHRMGLLPAALALYAHLPIQARW